MSGAQPAAGAASTPPGPGRPGAGHPSPLDAVKKKPALLAGIAGVAVVVFVAMKGAGSSGSSGSSGSTVPAASSGGVYDSTANDVYNSLAGQLQSMQADIDALGKTSDPSTKTPTPAPKPGTPPKPAPRPITLKPYKPKTPIRKPRAVKGKPLTSTQIGAVLRSKQKKKPAAKPAAHIAAKPAPKKMTPKKASPAQHALAAAPSRAVRTGVLNKIKAQPARPPVRGRRLPVHGPVSPR